MKKEKQKVKQNLLFLRNFLVFFGIVAFTVTCCMMLFLYGTDISEKFIRERAEITFINVIFLSILFTLIDYLRRYFSVKRPLNRILEATKKMRQGDFSVRIEKSDFFASPNEFGIIAEDINKLAEELSGVETLRTDFISNVSHELKTPLSVIQNYATLLQDETLSAEVRKEYTQTVMDASKRLSTLITNILRLNKLENQQIYPQNQKYNLSEQMCECLLGFETLWEEKNLQIETDIVSDIQIEADAELLALVWNNLLSNAMKFTDKGGTVSVTVKKEAETAIVIVSDTGCGISSETGKHIFEKFYQGDTAHTVQGNGLGLALVKRIIDIMKGEISVQSIVGKGSTFTVRLRGDTDG